MRKEIYHAIRDRITIEQNVDEDTRLTLRLSPTSVIYHFHPEGLNSGMKDWDIDYVDGILHPMSTRNMWNVCQRFYSFIKHKNDIDRRLLDPVSICIAKNFINN